MAARYGINPKTVAKWRKRSKASDLRMGPKEPSSTVLTKDEEALIVAFGKHTLLSLDDRLYALQESIPHLARSSLYRCLKRHDISRPPDLKKESEPKKRFKSYPIGFFISISPSLERSRENSICSWRSTVHPSLSWQSCMKERRWRQPGYS